MIWKQALIAVPLSAAILVPTAVAGNGTASAAEKPSVDTPGANLRATLGTLLSEHANLAMITMRKGIEGAKDFDAAAGQLAQNTDDLANAIGSVYGNDAAKAFKKMWSDHIGYFVEYVQGTAKNDKQKKQEALKQLSQYRDDFSKFLSKATGGRVESDALAQGLQEHVNQLVDGFKAYVNKDYATAYSMEAKASNHMFMTAKGLASAITDQMPDKFNNTMAVTPASDLREKLASLLSLHVSFAITAMQNGIEGQKSMDIFKANANALAKDTDELSDAIASVYGKEAGEQFHKMWSEHIGYFVDYVKATANKDKQRQQKALDNLKQYRQDFSQFIDKATGGEIPADALSQGLQMHVNQLVTAFNSYNSGDYEKAYASYDEAYKHINDTAKVLSNGIVKQFPDKFANSNMPSGMPKTDMGGTAGAQESEILAIALTAMAILVAGGTVIYRRKTKAAQ